MSASANAIPYWGYYGGMVGGGAYLDQDPSQSPYAQQFLTALHKYDPNARFVEDTGGGGEGGSGSPQWHLVYDPAKLPGGDFGGGNVDVNPGDYGPMLMRNSDAETLADAQAKNPGFGNFNAPLYDPNAISQDPTYGLVTKPSNVNNAAADRSWLDWAGPAAVLGFGALFGGLPFLTQGITGSLPGGASGAAGDAAGAAGSAAGDAAGTGIDMTGFQVPGGASGAFNAAVGGAAPAASLPGFQIPGGAAGMFGVAGSGVDPSTAAILNSINSPSLFDVGGAAGTALSGAADTQPAAPIVDQGTPARVSDVLRAGGTPGLSNIGQSLSEIPWGSVLNAVGKIPGLGGGTGTGSGGGSGGGSGLLQPYNMQPYKSLTQLLRNYGLLGMPNG